MSEGAAAGNPFPGLRSFEPAEASVFFGREEQCDHLLARLSQRRMVAVVGASGSGKSSLVKAGLIPALESGYLPSAGTDWRIAVCRPGTDPIGNLATGLNQLRRNTSPGAPLDDHFIRSTLDSSSLGLVECARALVGDSGDRLLVVIDQFEEIFRFSREGGANAGEDAASFVHLLIATAAAERAPVFIVITMRSDYLGDCGRFAGLPDTLNDSQFLVPRMSRDDIREAIEGPIAVYGGRITPRLVQRLLHDVEQLASGRGRPGGDTVSEPDPLPLMQHAMMRVWSVSADARAHGLPLDLAHYEDPPVCTVSSSLDRHAEELFLELPPGDRQIAERAFRQLTERDPRNRDIRRPTSLNELTAVALSTDSPSPAQREQVRAVLMRFAARGRSFLIFDEQDKVDISHESLIRQWRRLGKWVEQEASSKRIFQTLSEWAQGWNSGRRALYRGPELTEALEWVRTERPTKAWSERYGGDLSSALRYLQRSRLRRALVRSAVVGFAIVLAVLAAGYVRSQRLAADAANLLASERENEAYQRKQAADELAKGQAEAAFLRQQAADAYAKGQTETAARLTLEANRAAAITTPAPLPAGQAKELDGLRTQQKQWFTDKQTLLNQMQAQDKALADLKKEVADLKKLSSAKPYGDNAPPSNVTAGKPPADLPGNSISYTPVGGNNTTAKVVVTPSANYRNTYKTAIDLRDSKRWPQAEAEFRSAAAARPDTGETIEMKGFGYDQPYLPYYNLGVVLQEQGKCPDALDAWSLAEQTGAVQKSKFYDDLKRRRAQCQTAKR